HDRAGRAAAIARPPTGEVRGPAFAATPAVAAATYSRHRLHMIRLRISASLNAASNLLRLRLCPNQLPSGHCRVNGILSGYRLDRRLQTIPARLWRVNMGSLGIWFLSRTKRAIL